MSEIQVRHPAMSPDESPDKRLVEIAKVAWKHVKELKGVDDFRALEMLLAASHYWLGELHAFQTLLALGTAKWCHAGFPVVTLSEDLLFSLLATKVPWSVADRVQMPWPSFLVKLPPGVLFLEDLNNKPSTLVHVLMHTAKIHRDRQQEELTLRWGYHGMDAAGFSLDHSGPKEYLWDEKDEASPMSGLLGMYEQTGSDLRTQVLLRRLMVNVCLSLSDRTHWKLHTRSQLGKLRQSKDPIRREYVYVGEVKYRASQDVRDYCAGTGRLSALTQQSMVAGHWKQVVCGHRGQSRREQWIQPYWRGPEDAPIAVRL